MAAEAPLEPMEALLAEEVPDGPGWQYEPKWDGFRCLAIKDGAMVALWSKSGKPLGRYFPDVVATIEGLRADRFTLDGELVIVADGRVAFDALQLRLHPAESRVRKLAADSPALFIAFDLLRAGGKPLLERPLAGRRAALEKLIAKEDSRGLLLSPTTTDRKTALGWLGRSGGALDGVIAKRLDQPYAPGERAMVKVKTRRTADCVVGGFRRERKGNEVASLLLGLYDEAGRLDHVGFTSSLSDKDRPGWTAELEEIAGGAGFTGKAPGGPSRWTTDRTADWTPVEPLIVVEVLYDQVTGDRFRHGTRLVRRRSDKAPRQCSMEQLRHPLTPAELDQLIGR